MLNVTYHDNASKHDFLLDSGAISHMSCESSWLHNLHPIPSREIQLANNSMIQADAAGDLVLEAPSHKNSALKLTIKDVLLVPKLGLNLLSCSRLAEKGVTSVFDKYGCALIETHNHNDILARANLRDNLYWISAHPKFTEQITVPNDILGPLKIAPCILPRSLKLQWSSACETSTKQCLHQAYIRYLCDCSARSGQFPSRHLRTR
jgi:hypothetical protein